MMHAPITAATVISFIISQVKDNKVIVIQYGSSSVGAKLSMTPPAGQGSYTVHEFLLHASMYY